MTRYTLKENIENVTSLEGSCRHVLYIRTMWQHTWHVLCLQLGRYTRMGRRDTTVQSTLSSIQTQRKQNYSRGVKEHMY